MATNSLKSKYRIVRYPANEGFGTKESLAAEEVIDQTLDNRGLADAMHALEPTLTKGMALMAVNALGEVVKNQLAESHAVQISDLDGNVLFRLHHDVKLEWKDEKGKPLSLTLENVKKYIDPNATELKLEHVPTQYIVLRAEAEATNGFTKTLRAASSLQREGEITNRKANGEGNNPGTPSTPGGTGNSGVLE